jgi:hypothetical protein
MHTTGNPLRRIKMQKEISPFYKTARNSLPTASILSRKRL